MRRHSHSVIVRLTISYISVAILTSLLIVVVSYSLQSVEWQPVTSSNATSSLTTSFTDPLGMIEVDVLEMTAVPMTLVIAAAVGILSIPAALLLVWLTGRPLARRLGRIAAASHQFASGDHAVRVVDATPDEVGEVAQQFNNMADALQQQVHLLRSLAQENAALARTVEAAATHAERIRLSQDLHDALAQQLFSLTYGLSSLPDLIRHNASAGAARADVLSEIAEKALLDLRAMLLQVRPYTQSEKGFATTIRDIVAAWQHLYDIPVDLVIVLDEQVYSAVVQHTLCLILQEALINTAKHARASTLSIRLQVQPPGITLTIQDNGIGFITKPVRSGYGLTHMRERAEAIGGVMTLHSSEGGGTVVSVYVPHTV